MGIFSSKTEHVYTPYSSTLYEDVPGLVHQTIRVATHENRNIGKDLVANLVNGVLFKANSLYNAGASGSLPWGLPNGHTTAVLPTTHEKVKAIIQAEVGAPIHLNYVVVKSAEEEGVYAYEAEYYLQDHTGNIGEGPYLWEYASTEGTYPTLAVPEKAENSPYYPITPIRINNVNLGEEGQPERDDIRRALRYLDINVDDLYESMAESTKEADEPPADDMFVILGVSISRNTARTNEYLYRYFRKLQGEQTVTKADHDFWKESQNRNNVSNPPTNTLNIRDSRYNQDIEWDYITHKVHTGTVGKVGEYSVEYTRNNGRYQGVSGYYYADHGVFLRHQVNADQYEEIYVHGLLSRVQVIGKKWVDISLEAAFENPDSPQDGQAFIIPLRKDVCRDMGNIRAHDLMYESIRLFSNDHTTYKVKWYQRGFFKVFLFVLAVAITVITQNPGAGMAAFTAAAVTTAIAQVILAQLVFTAVMPLLEDLVGQRAALLLAVLATAFGVGMTFNGGTLAVTTNTTVSSVANAAMQGVSGFHNLSVQSDLRDLQDAWDELSADMDELNAEINQRQYDVALVTNTVTSDPYALMEPSNHVALTLLEPTIPTLITHTTARYPEIATYLDTSQTPLNLGHS